MFDPDPSNDLDDSTPAPPLPWEAAWEPADTLDAPEADAAAPEAA